MNIRVGHAADPAGFTVASVLDHAQRSRLEAGIYARLRCRVVVWYNGESGRTHDVRRHRALE